MANLKGINPANSGDANARAVEANVHRLDRNPSIANERPGTAEADRARKLASPKPCRRENRTAAKSRRTPRRPKNQCGAR